MISNRFSSSDIHLRKNQIFDAPRNFNTNHLCIDQQAYLHLKKNTQITLASTFSLLLRLYPVLTKARLTMPQVTVYKWMWSSGSWHLPIDISTPITWWRASPLGTNALRACGYHCPFLLLAVTEDGNSSGLPMAWYGTNNWIGTGSPGHVWPETFLCECVKQIPVCLSSRMNW